MACRGCSQVGDCACAVVGDGGAITVTGSGSALDPYTISLNSSTWMASITSATPDLCTETWTVLGRKSDGTVRRIPMPGRCAVIL